MAAMNPHSPLLVRMPADLKVWLAEHSENNGRKMSNEIVQLIKAERDRSAQPKEIPS